MSAPLFYLLFSFVVVIVFLLASNGFINKPRVTAKIQLCWGCQLSNLHQSGLPRMLLIWKEGEKKVDYLGSL